MSEVGHEVREEAEADGRGAERRPTRSLLLSEREEAVEEPTVEPTELQTV